MSYEGFLGAYTPKQLHACEYILATYRKSVIHTTLTFIATHLHKKYIVYPDPEEVFIVYRESMPKLSEDKGIKLLVDSKSNFMIIIAKHTDRVDYYTDTLRNIILRYQYNLPFLAKKSICCRNGNTSARIGILLLRQ